MENPEHSEQEPAQDETELERLKASVDVVASKYGEADREKLKDNLQYHGIRQRYADVKNHFEKGDPNHYYLILLEDLMHDIEDFPD